MHAKRDSTSAVLRFRHSAGGSGVSRTGHVRPGGRLIVEYDAARLPVETSSPAARADVVCHVLFAPGGQVYEGSVPAANTGGTPGPPGLATFEVLVPDDAASVELWFESRGPTGTVAWDSHYGANYSFAITGQGLPVPEPSVVLRPGVIADPARIRVIDDAATKATARLGSSGKRVQTGLVIRALVADASSASDVWADIHVFDGSDELIQTGSLVLQFRELTPDGALFVWDEVIYQGSGGGSGMGVWSRPDTHTIQYRVYCQAHQSAAGAEPQVFTDDILHEFEVPADQDTAGA